jgi:hypothetical protein
MTTTVTLQCRRAVPRWRAEALEFGFRAGQKVIEKGMEGCGRTVLVCDMGMANRPNALPTADD